MSQGNNGKYWSAALLRRRGWTNDLMEKLLPGPQYRWFRGKKTRVWERKSVQEAEKTEQFQRERIRRSAPVREPADPAGIDRTAKLLIQAWEKAGREDTLAWVLAGHYHAAILQHLPAAAQRFSLRVDQGAGYMGQFLNLERRCDPKKLHRELAHFARSGSWLGANQDNSMARRVLNRYALVLHAAAERAVYDFQESQPEAELSRMLRQEDFPAGMLFSMSLGGVWSVWYVPRAIQNSLSLLLALNPKDEYPEARAMQRHFTLHIGGTNTGKTYAGFQRLREAETGVYLAPLRLLALEAQETMLDAGIDCSLTTGEEEDLREGDTHVAATAEKLDLKARYQVAVIDECQMISDAQRGYAWTRAILGVLAPEVHLCAAPEARHILIRLIESCGDTFDVEYHRRQVPLIPMSSTVDYSRIQPGDALITFSKVGVLSVAEDLRQAGKEPAIIYGALPYATRRKQMEGFLSGRMQYVVATDAIGMGLNLPIRRIIFMETEKFDGVERRELKPEEIQQIAGRAGRFGMYDRGYVGATQGLGFIRAGLHTTVPPIQHAVVGFSDLVLQVRFDLLEVLTQWSRMPTPDPYVKLDISRYISLISKMREMGFLLDKEQELRAANIPFDETEEPLRELFFKYLRLYLQGETIEQPGFPEDGNATLPELELLHRKLDLYFSFARAFSLPVDEDKLYETRSALAESINEILLYKLRNNIRFCAKCGAALPLHQKGRLCDACFRKTRRTLQQPVWRQRQDRKR